MLKVVNLKLNKKLRLQVLESCENLIIKENTDYTIYKEKSTGVYILSIPKLLVIQYKYTRNLEDFLLLYADSNLSFDIYKNCNYYYIVCVSKYKDTFNYKLWLTANDSNYKYTLLTNIYNSFFVINKPWYLKKKNFTRPKIYKKPQNSYTFYKSVGNGIINNKIRNELKMFIKMINEMQFLPCHYLNY